MYRLQLLDRQRYTPGSRVKERSLILPATHPSADEFAPQALAASDSEEDFLSVSHEDEELVCTLCRNEEGQIVIEFRSEAPNLQGGRVSLIVTDQGTGEVVCEKSLDLHPDARGVFTAHAALDDLFKVDLTQSYKIDYDAVFALQ